MKFEPRQILAVAFGVAFAAIAAADKTPLTTIKSVMEAVQQKREWVPFSLEVKALSPLIWRGGGAFLAEDWSGRAIIHAVPKCDSSSVAHGGLLKVSGETSRCDLNAPSSAIMPFAKSIASIGREEMPLHPEAKVRDILSGKWDLRYVTVTGTVKDAFHDDIDPRFAFLILVQDGSSMYVPLCKRPESAVELASFIGAEVSVSGIVHRNDGTGARRYADVTIFCGGFDSVRILREADGMDLIPVLEDVRSLNPESISTMDRRKASGRVIAVWGGNRFMMKMASGEIMRIELADTKPPRCGDFVEAAGFPRTDLFNVNFESAMWRPLPDCAPPSPDVPTENVSAKTLLAKTDGTNIANSRFFGKTVSLEGIVLNVSESADGRILLESGGFAIPVDASACPVAFNGVVAGCRVSVEGVFVFDADNWRANDLFPKIHDVAVVVRTSNDVRVLSRPSWWTAGKLIFVIGLLAAAIAVVLIWNGSLRVLAERRGQALYRARMAKSASELRLDERTRLATELHDYISQDMTAISYQVTAARRSRGVDDAACEAHLDTADRMLASCRTELRRCLWDLRNETLDERDVAKAVRTSIAPIVGDVAATVEMDVPRKCFDDTAMHTMLSIVRELVANAVNHGCAKSISICGKTFGDVLTLVVADDGKGFDVARVPGIDAGHFGLAGVRERASRHEGDVSVESAPGKGTRITVSLHLPQNPLIDNRSHAPTP